MVSENFRFIRRFSDRLVRQCRPSARARSVGAPPRTLLAFRSSGHKTLSLLYSPSKMLFASSHPSSQISRSSLSAGYGQSSRGMSAPYASMPCPKISVISITLLHAFYGSEACKAANFKMTHYRQSPSISPTNATPEATPTSAQIPPRTLPGVRMASPTYKAAAQITPLAMARLLIFPPAPSLRSSNLVLGPASLCPLPLC